MIDSGLFEVFRGELETHSDAITTELLALEKGTASAKSIEAMMRAAHSIKGAARIVGVEPLVRVAHVMEDYFVGIQEGRFVFSNAAVDDILKGVDFFQKAAQVHELPDDWSAELNGPADVVLQAVGRLTSPSPQELEVDPRITTERHGSVIHVRVDADLAGDLPEAIRKHLSAARREGAEKAVLDVATVTEVDPLGLLLLKRLADAASTKPPFAIELANAPEDLVALLRASGLLSLLHSNARDVAR